MNILSVIYYPTFGGPHNRNRALIPCLEKEKIKTIVLLPKEHGNAAELLGIAGIPIIQIPLNRVRAKSIKKNISMLFFLYRDIQQIRNIIRAEKIDIVQINGSINLHAAFAAWLEKKAIVWQILDTTPPLFLRKLFMPIIVKLADVVMCTGKKVAEQHPGALSLESRLINFYPPVDTKTYINSPEKKKLARKALGVATDTLLIGTVGVIYKNKGHHILLDSISRLPSDLSFQVRIIGSTPLTHLKYKKYLQEKIRMLGFKDGQVDIVDPKNNVANLLPALDIFLSASLPDSEGIPTAILEAMSVGLPVVATDVASISEVVYDNETGFIVPPLDPGAMCARILELAHNLELRVAMGENSRTIAEQKFDLHICKETHIRAFQMALEHNYKK